MIKDFPVYNQRGEVSYIITGKDLSEIAKCGPGQHCRQCPFLDFDCLAMRNEVKAMALEIIRLSVKVGGYNE